MSRLRDTLFSICYLPAAVAARCTSSLLRAVPSVPVRYSALSVGISALDELCGLLVVVDTVASMRRPYRSRVALLAAFPLLLFPSYVPGCTQPEQSGQVVNLDAVAARLLSQGNRQVAVFRDGVLVGETSNAHERQRAASVSKIITSAAVFALVDQGKLSLDEQLGAIVDLASFGIVPAAGKADSTVADLLGNTSGLPADRGEWFGGRFTSCVEAARVALARRGGSPGRYVYSNTNFCLLSLVVSARAQMGYQDAVRDLVFVPLGIDAEYDPAYVRLEGAGAWMISAHDIGLLVDALDPDGLGSRVLLSPGARALMSAPRTYNYGLGVWRWPTGAWGHSGSLNAARNIVVHLPTGETVAVMVQANSPASGLDLYNVAKRFAASV